MPTSWRILMVVLVVFLIASVVIGAYRLATTPTEVLGDGFRGWQGSGLPR